MSTGASGCRRRLLLQKKSVVTSQNTALMAETQLRQAAMLKSLSKEREALEKEGPLARVAAAAAEGRASALTVAATKAGTVARLVDCDVLAGMVAPTGPG